MSNLFATAPIEEVRPDVVTREKILEGPLDGVVVEVKVRKDAAQGKAGEGENAVRYLWWRNAIYRLDFSDGFLVSHVRSEDLTLRGRTIQARIEVWKATYSTGVTKVYVDFKPVPAGTQSTHRYAILPRPPVSAKEPGWEIIPVDNALQGQGFIVIAPKGAKIVQPSLEEPAPNPLLSSVMQI